MADISLAQGLFLIQRRHYREAEQALRQALAQTPENARAHAYLALALSAQNRPLEAVAEARQAVGLAPNQAYSHYVLAMTLYHAEQNENALAASFDALRLDPDDVDYHEMQGKIYLAMEHWEQALESARNGLAIDPQDVDCANLRAMALVQLGRQGEAGSVIDQALELDPENALTHANVGWASLHAGNYQEAFIHFREALRLKPDLEWARHGIIEAMKARNILYRPLLAYFLWMGRLSGRTRWALVVGLWVLTRFLRSLSRVYPNLNPVILPIIGVYLVFGLMTWIAVPLFNLFLRLDKFGRLALSKEEITASNWLGLCIFSGLGLLVAGAIIHSDQLLLSGMGCLAMSIPVAGIFRGKSQRSRILLIAYTLVLVVLGALAIVNGLVESTAGSTLMTLFLLGWVLYTWIANFLIGLD